MKHNALYIQSGGPTSVINASAYGVIQGCKENDHVIGRLYSAKHGIIGLINKNLIDVYEIDKQQIELLPKTPGMIFGSCRYYLKDAKEDDSDHRKILSVLQKYDIRYIFINGGNGTVKLAEHLKAYLDAKSYQCNIIVIPKTVDNDISHIDHTPGFPSAARHVAISISELSYELSTYDTGLIMTVEVMGRHTGFLAAASLLALKTGNCPDLIYVPEVVFSPEKFISDVEKVFNRKKKCMAVIAEGVRTQDSRYLFEFYDERKAQNPEMNMGGISPYVYNLLKEHFKCKIRCIDLGLMQRCSSYTTSKLDLEEALLMGKFAVKAAVDGESGKMVSIVRLSNKPYKTKLQLVPIEDVVKEEARLPLHYLNAEKNHINAEYLDYIEPLVGPLPTYERINL